ncbi:MAG: DUF1080 domain-containing protein [Opitutaceae bacterium]|jgi:hypothetical protein|nr:DUF1080 domain-containing protein [Opitutaceae bacterium]
MKKSLRLAALSALLPALLSAAAVSVSVEPGPLLQLTRQAAAAQGAERLRATDALLAELASPKTARDYTPAQRLHTLHQLRHLVSTPAQTAKLLGIAAALKDPAVRMFLFEYRSDASVADAYKKAQRDSQKLLLDGKPAPDKKNDPADAYGRNAFDARATYDSWDDIHGIIGRYQNPGKTLVADIVAEPAQNYRARLVRPGAAPVNLLAFPAIVQNLTGAAASNEVVLQFIGPGVEATLRDGALTLVENGARETLTRAAVGKVFFENRPANATVLLDPATGLKHFTSSGKPPRWKLLPGGIVQSVPKAGSLHTTGKYADSLLYVEFRVANNPEALGQHRGNSGVFPQPAYEIQILDSFGLDARDNDCGGLYHVAAPAVNMSAPPLEWQSYLIHYTAPRFDASGQKTANARVTVWQNGVKIQDALEIPRNTSNPKGPEPKTPTPIALQQHTSVLQFRNIWVIPDPTPADIAAAAPR